MSEPPIFRRILASGSDHADKTITIALSDGGEEGIRVDLALSIAGPLLALLHAEAAKLNADLTEDERALSATLLVQAAWLSQDEESRPMLVFELSNGSLLPLVLRAGDFAGLAAEMALLAGKPTGSKH